MSPLGCKLLKNGSGVCLLPDIINSRSPSGGQSFFEEAAARIGTMEPNLPFMRLPLSVRC